MIVTFGVVFRRLCPKCHSDLVGFGAIGALAGIVTLIVLVVTVSKWLWG
jgi:hypothetical protein